MTLCELLNLSVLQTPRLGKGTNHGAFLTGLLRRVHEGT